MEYGKMAFFSCRGVSSNDFSSLEALCKKIIKEKQTFERLEVKKETLLEMFKVNWALTTCILSANPWSSAPQFPLEKHAVLVCSEKCDLTRIPAACLEINTRGPGDVSFLIFSTTSSSAGYWMRRWILRPRLSIGEDIECCCTQLVCYSAFAKLPFPSSLDVALW